MTPADLRKRFANEVPEQFVLASVKVIAEGYQTGAKLCERYDDPERHDLLSSIRRAEIEMAWRHLGKSFGTADSGNQPNSNGGAHHTYIQIGSFLLTQSAVARKNELVRYAEFRTGLAESAQLDFFIKPRPRVNAPIYGIILHGPRSPETRLPEFITLAFPTRDMSSYFEAIDLTSLLMQAAPQPEFQEETIADADLVMDLKDSLKKDKKKKKEID